MSVNSAIGARFSAKSDNNDNVSTTHFLLIIFLLIRMRTAEDLSNNFQPFLEQIKTKIRTLKILINDQTPNQEGLDPILY